MFSLFLETKVNLQTAHIRKIDLSDIPLIRPQCGPSMIQENVRNKSVCVLFGLFYDSTAVIYTKILLRYRIKDIQGQSFVYDLERERITRKGIEVKNFLIKLHTSNITFNIGMS